MGLNLLTPALSNLAVYQNATHPAATTQQYYWYRNYPISVALLGNNAVHTPLPDDWWIISPGSFSSLIENIDVDDQLSQVSVRVARQISGNL